jgi:hypothetical protein
MHMAIVAFMLALVLLFVVFEPLPIVQLTWPEEACVQVVPEARGYTCDQLPDRFEIEWVAPRD